MKRLGDMVQELIGMNVPFGIGRPIKKAEGPYPFYIWIGEVDDRLEVSTDFIEGDLPEIIEAYAKGIRTKDIAKVKE
jgi:hypothetical protein